MPFDIGFLELCLVTIVGLVVLGPERLPVAARAIGRWIGKARRAFSSFKQEIDRELQIDELRQQIKQQQQQMDAFMNRPMDEETPEELQKKIAETRQQFERDKQQQTEHHQSIDSQPDDELDEQSGCDNPVEFEPLPREQRQTNEPTASAEKIARPKDHSGN